MKLKFFSFFMLSFFLFNLNDSQACTDTILTKAIKKNDLQKVKRVLPLVAINGANCIYKIVK